MPANDYISTSWRKRTAENVLGMMGIRESILAKAGDNGGDDEHFEENEKSMIRSVLTLAERPIMGRDDSASGKSRNWIFPKVGKNKMRS